MKLSGKRLHILLCTYFVLGVYLLIACGFLCFVKGDEYTSRAVSQRKTAYVVKNHRGKFLDRSMIPLVETEQREQKMDSFGRLTSSGDIAVPALTVRYGENSPASHLIGYVDSDGKGVCGLEKFFDSDLITTAKSTVNTVCGADGRVIDTAGISLTQDSGKGNNVVLTLDIHIQKLAENALRQYGVTGAAVVMDTGTFDVLAMASSPGYDPNRVEDYLNLTDGELVNRCLMPYNAGSIFKIVTLSSGLENGCVRGSYFCDGSREINGRTFACHKADGHGVSGYVSAFSDSCNCAFYTMGTDLGTARLVQSASAFGLGKKLLTGVDIGEHDGNLPSVEGSAPLDSVNLAIGQGEVLITPLQAANMACIIANGGVARNVNICKYVCDSHGNTVRNLYLGEEKRVMNGYCASLVADAMRKVVTQGTASSLDNPRVEIAGKTGTAETGWVKDGKNLVHGWFCGFFPASSPRYAVAVLAEDGGSGSLSAAPVFGYIAEEITKIYPPKQ